MTHTHTLADPRIEAALSLMFERAEQDETTAARVSAQLPGGFAPLTPQERADAVAEVYMPISARGGQLLYNLVRAVCPATVVEFGMSFGISTLYLAAAVRDNGTGRVITTELSKDKIAAARRTFTETGLDDLITTLEGDARDTLHSLDAPADFVLLDGWKELCLPVLRLLEPRLRPGTLVVADDVDLNSLRPYLDYVRDPANGYQSVTFPVEDGMEISCRL
ncbi:O-methyltransferase [Streptomyces acidiscabies]|uniref:Class I SAM-dependent methyltransferase n=1 Tax=Streptomyces acidiscabies TaxID=42234 RepID=A0AAP6B5A0_9ACTN|nr:class I SAM-dependent methyltransferase [Streptomyces acidiscabies]MBP5941549.1 methyltransferase [Streptomyces sp. LBUM 1476]MBZ3912936.1 class I SAM-dependent methyltransferase [Streptomyces acidiscabies]MDX2958422.1 class I SAM-dependent methyltransferase [Streptomyces acidiscabies]MDX3021072.1 class I SAM-dependent methyltransferase [Streptomyces acidiscabies]MDX3790908.1 class I SAM-dependent methyltransferase [Streptomyces acidiscabies]